MEGEAAGVLTASQFTLPLSGSPMQTPSKYSRIRVLRPFYYAGTLREIGASLIVAHPFAREMINTNKAELVRDVKALPADPVVDEPVAAPADPVVDEPVPEQPKPSAKSTKQ